MRTGPRTPPLRLATPTLTRIDAETDRAGPWAPVAGCIARLCVWKRTRTEAVSSVPVSTRLTYSASDGRELTIICEGSSKQHRLVVPPLRGAGQWWPSR